MLQDVNGQLESGIVCYGDRARPAIVFLHGIRLGGQIWEPHARALSDEFFVVTPDLPGHGALAHLPFEIPLCYALLDRIASRCAAPPLIVGYSLGGYVAMHYALADTARTSALLLADCSTDVTGYRELLYEIGVGITAQFPDPFVERVLAIFFRLTLPRRVADVVIPFRFNQRVFESSRAVASGIEYSAKLASYGKPVLIVNGEYDLLFRPDERKYARATGARVIVMPNTDHVAPLRRPREFTAMTRAFAREVYAKGTLAAGRLT